MVNDVIGARARGNAVTTFCTQFGLEKTFGCSVLKFERYHIDIMADEWMRKMQFFYDEFKSTVAPDGVVFSDEFIESYIEGAAFAELVRSSPQRGDTYTRCMDVRKLQPTARPCEAGKAGPSAKKKVRL